jgi:type IV secretory pathway VirJ component
MRRWWLLLLLWSAAQCGAETLSHGRFQNLEIYRPIDDVQRVVLFLSGEQGWNEQLASSAQRLASQGALVAGIDSRALFAELERDGAECIFPDGDLENLSHFLQAYYRLPSYRPAVLVGYGAGATLSYAMLAQAPAETFAGAVSVDFSSELRLRKRLCEANALRFRATSEDRSVLAPAKPAAPWIVLQSKSAGWQVALTKAVRRIDPPLARATTPEELAGLPIVEVPAKHPGTTLAILISGDGGWAGIDKAVAAALAERGIAVVGVDSLRYFWKERTPQSTAADIDRIVQHYIDEWDRKEVVLIGYSQGADVLPFVVNRLPAQTRARIRLAAMLGPSERATFEFRLADWLSSSDEDGLPIAPEMRRMSGVRALCVYSEDEDGSSCLDAASGTLRALSLPGGHHFGGDYDRVAALILEQLR